MFFGHYLQRHRNRYRFRMRYPKGLVAFDFPGELIVALGTDSFSLALKRARFLRVAVESLMIDLSGALRRSDAERMVRGWVNDSTRQWEANMALSGGFAFFDKDEVETMGEENAREMDDLMRVVGETMVRPQIKAVASAELSGRSGGSMRALQPVIGAAMAEHAPQVDPASLDGKLLTRAFVRGLATLVDEQSALERGELVLLPQAHTEVAPTPVVVPVPTMPDFPFLSHWDEFEADKVREGDWKADTASNARSTRNLFQSLFAGMSVGSVNRAIAADFRKQLFGLPSRYDKEKRWRGMDLREIIASAPQLDRKARRGEKGAAGAELKPVRFMKLGTVDKHFNNLVEYWAWLQRTGKIPSDAANAFRGFIQSKPQGKRARKARNIWPQEMLTTLFTSPVWTGCSSLGRRSKAGAHIFRDAKFWVPLIGRMIGAREDEICSLTVGDIREIGGLHVFHIADSKTDGSERDLPLPEALLIMGFLEYRFYGRAPDEPLFPELLPQGVGDRQSASFSSWFTEYRKAIEVYQLLVDFHSLRHNVSTDLENMPGLNLGWADEITGHESDVRTSERARYSKGVYMQNLKDTLDRIDIGVNLDHLAYDGEYGVAASSVAKDIAMFTERAVRDMAVKASRRKTDHTARAN
jgi:integrase